MHSTIISHIAAVLRDQLSPSPDDAAWFSDQRYAAVPFSTRYFHQILPEASEDMAEKNNTQLAFIDGGNVEILTAPNFSLQFIRIYVTIYKNNRRHDSRLYEQYVLIYAAPGEGTMRYRVKLFPVSTGRLPLDETSLIFDSMDPAFRVGHFRASIASMGNAVRDLLELQASRLALDALAPGDCLVRDGTLQATNHLQANYFADLFGAATTKGILVVGVAKTCDLVCASGKSVLAVIARLADNQEQKEQKRWYYTPLVEINNEQHPAIAAIAKFHPRSTHLFRCEVHKAFSASVPRIMARLAQNSRDPIFLGYPYGLIEADQFARVSHREGEYWTFRFMSQWHHEWSAILPFVNATNAHAILDNIH